MDQISKDYPRFSRSSSSNSDVFEPTLNNSAMQRASLVGWLMGILPDIRLPLNASDEELQSLLADGSLLCRILNKLKPGCVPKCDASVHNSQSRSGNIQKFLSAMDEMGLPRFQALDLEKGSMKPVLDCLLTLQTQFMVLSKNNANDAISRWKSSAESTGNICGVPREESFLSNSSTPFGGDRRKLLSDSRIDRGVGPRITEPSPALINHVGQKFHEVFQLKQGSYMDLPAAKISEMMKSNSLDNAPTQSLLSVVNGILDESIDRKTGEIPHRVACLLRKVVQEIERRICTQAEHLRTQNNLFKAREEKYQSRVRVLEALAAGTSEETQIVKNQLQQIKNERSKLEETKEEEQEVGKLMKEKDKLNQEIAKLRQLLENVTKDEPEMFKESKEQDLVKLMKDNDSLNKKIANSMQQLESVTNEREGFKEPKEQDLVRLMKETDRLNQKIATLMQQMECAKDKTEGFKESKEQDLVKLMKENDSLNQKIVNLRQQMERLKNDAAEDRKESKEQDLVKLMKDKDSLNQEIANLRQQLESAKDNKTEEKTESKDQDLVKLMKEKDSLNQEIANLRQQLESAKDNKTEEKKESKEHDLVKLMKEKDSLNQEIANLGQQLESVKKDGESKGQDVVRLMKEKDVLDQQITNVKQELEMARGSIEKKSEMEAEAGKARCELEDRLREVERLLTESRKRVKELEISSEEKSKQWTKKNHIYHIFTDFQLGALRELRFASQNIQQELVKTRESYSDEFSTLGSKIKILDIAARNYDPLLAENRKLHNEIQELKGNIRVYCRVRPFLPGQKGRQSIVEYIGENGQLVTMNPAKKGKEGRRSFKFNKVYGPTGTQAVVFADIQPLIQSVLDGYNVCIFAYGQTGSGKTYTMTGPDGATEEELGVNYRSLNDLFRISQERQGCFKYEVSVQMVEIYNEQIRDLLINDGPQKKLGVLNTSKPNGLAVPDANIQPVTTTSDVVKLMDIGLKNRARSSTALNERSSRSHSIVSIHCQGTDLKGGSTLRGSLHLVDLAGSERVDRSEVTGDRLKEAQHINKSLAALGDVIYALSQKSAHVPYRNSKLTQVLQSSLGGQAKTLMFVQLNPDHESYTESMSTLKFAERVSGVELGAAKSSKEGKDVRELIEQVASLKDTIAKKDEEILTLQQLKGAS